MKHEKRCAMCCERHVLPVASQNTRVLIEWRAPKMMEAERTDVNSKQGE